MKRLTLIPGTHAWQPAQTSQWWHPASTFVRYLAQAGFPLVSHEPFVWSSDVDGIFGDRGHSDWRCGGANLYHYLVPVLCPDKRLPPEETVIIAHSHGSQVALYAAAMGLQIDTLITVAGPVRGDMREVTARARPQIRRWLHLHSDHSDYMQWLGAIGDGTLGIYRAQPLADENVKVPQVGHGGLLNDPAQWYRWREWLKEGR